MASAQVSATRAASPPSSLPPRTCSTCSSARSAKLATKRDAAGVAIALDPAANGFYRDGAYDVNGEALSSDEMIERYAEMLERFPIWSLEDGLGGGRPVGWERLTDRLGERVQLVGDDLLVTNPAIIAEAIDHKVANAALIKPNQIGTVTRDT